MTPVPTGKSATGMNVVSCRMTAPESFLFYKLFESSVALMLFVTIFVKKAYVLQALVLYTLRSFISSFI